MVLLIIGARTYKAFSKSRCKYRTYRIDPVDYRIAPQSKNKENPEFAARISGDDESPNGPSGQSAWEEQSVALSELSNLWQDATVGSILARQGQADEKLFQDDSGFE